jgi:Family of unknown function (DUF5996)
VAGTGVNSRHGHRGDNEAAPEEMILDFLQSTYEEGARLAQWDRATLEKHSPQVGGILELPSPTTKEVRSKS